MTIGEAIDLILQAFAVGQSGTFVLEMGDPVSILELARKMIAGRLIEIEMTGLRPGEKLAEELFAEGEAALPTAHDRVKAIRPARTDYALMEQWVRRLEELVMRRDAQAIEDHLRLGNYRAALATNRSW
jgi:O-antigen biosynthesis protein WbqV